MSVSVVLLKFPADVKLSYILNNNIAHPILSVSVVLIKFPVVSQLSYVLNNNVAHPIVSVSVVLLKFTKVIHFHMLSIIVLCIVSCLLV